MTRYNSHIAEIQVCHECENELTDLEIKHPLYVDYEDGNSYRCCEDCVLDCFSQMEEN